LSQADLEALGPQGDEWWPSLPEFNVGFDPAPTAVVGERFWVVQSYEQVGASEDGSVQTTLILFDDETSATEGFDTISDASDGDSTTLDGPAVADQWRYFSRSTDEGPYETTLRFRAGPIVGRITVFSERGQAEPQTLAGYFAPVAERIDDLLGGRLSAAPLPQDMAGRMPSESAGETVGPTFGSAVIPAESWALADLTSDPQAVRGRLRELGATELGLRRYGLQADPDHIVEIVLFPMADEEAAETWVREFIDAAGGEGALSAGDTGGLSAFTSYDGSAYELQFAKGRFVGDVICFAPFGETSASCEEPVRSLAERWYAELPEG